MTIDRAVLLLPEVRFGRGRPRGRRGAVQRVGASGSVILPPPRDVKVVLTDHPQHSQRRAVPRALSVD